MPPERQQQPDNTEQPEAPGYLSYKTKNRPQHGRKSRTAKANAASPFAPLQSPQGANHDHIESTCHTEAGHRPSATGNRFDAYAPNQHKTAPDDGAEQQGAS
jgi:hypothetical protein